MTKLVLIRPNLGLDPVFDPVRCASFYGWQRLIQSCPDHEIRTIDSVCEGINNKRLIHDGKDSTISYEEFIQSRNSDMISRSPEQFLSEYDQRFFLKVGLDTDVILQRIGQNLPDVIGLTSFSTREHPSTVALAIRINEFFPDIPIIVGGTNATFNAEQLLTDSKGAIRYVFRGAGEKTLNDFLNGNLPTKGIAYMKDNKYLNLGIAFSQFIADNQVIEPRIIDNLVQPKTPNYVISPDDVNKYTDFMFSEGCPGKCGFCSISKKEGGYREMDYDILDRQLDLFKEFGYNFLVIENNEFCISKAESLALHFIKATAKRNIQWVNNGGMNLDIMSDQMVDELCNSTCYAVAANFNPRSILQTATTKNRSTLFGKLQRLSESGIKIYTSIIIGTPYQTRDEIRSEIDTLAEIVREKIVTSGMLLCLSYFPGTEYTLSTGHLIDDRVRYTGQSIFVPHAGTTTGLTRNDIAYELVRGLKIIYQNQNEIY